LTVVLVLCSAPSRITVLRSLEVDVLLTLLTIELWHYSLTVHVSVEELPPKFGLLLPPIARTLNSVYPF
jgi:hypothetical protein